jgi:hypothetical protein
LSFGLNPELGLACEIPIEKTRKPTAASGLISWLSRTIRLVSQNASQSAARCLDNSLLYIMFDIENDRISRQAILSSIFRTAARSSDG